MNIYTKRNNVIKLKSILGEGFAWERKADGSLPTIADTTAAYQSKLREQEELAMPEEDEEEPVEEGAKPDFLDLDKDGDKEESMRDAAAEKEDVNESFLISKSGEQQIRNRPLLERITKNLYGNK
jgi:hypothetical protein